MKQFLTLAIMVAVLSFSFSSQAEGPTCFDVKVRNGGVYVLDVNVYHRNSHCKGNDSASLTKGKEATLNVSANSQVKLQAVAGRSKTIKIQQMPQGASFQGIHCGGTTFEGFDCTYIPE